MKSGFVFGLIVTTLLACGVDGHSAETTAPNILLISGDDMGVYLGCYDDRFVKTPNMDRIAKQGIRFDNAWVTQASCSPSRSSIMTGLYPHQNGQIGLAHLGFSMSREFPTIPSLLNEAGYYTGLVGKLHIKPESAFPFQFLEPEEGSNGKNPRAYANHVADFLKKAGEKPLFLHASFRDPHKPFKSQVEGLPANPLEAGDVEPFPFMGELEGVSEVMESVAGYYNGIMRVDAGVGLILDQFKKAGQLENTMIIIIGDHGAPFPRAKVSSYNAGLHIPFIVKWPGVSTPGTSSAALVSTIDILPTILDAAGLPIPDTLPGHSLRASVADPSNDPRDYMFAEFTTHQPEDYYPRRTVRDKRYQLILNLMSDAANPNYEHFKSPVLKAIRQGKGTSRTQELYHRYVHPPRIELYDLENDPGSLINLAGDPRYAKVQARLTKALTDWRERTNDPLNPGEIKRLGREIEKITEQVRSEKKKSKKQRRKSQPDKPKINSETSR